MTAPSITTPEGRASLRALLAAATPGPWAATGFCVDTVAGVGLATCDHATEGGMESLTDRSNAALIVAAVNTLPAAIQAAEELAHERGSAKVAWVRVADAEAERDEYRAALGRANADHEAAMERAERIEAAAVAWLNAPKVPRAYTECGEQQAALRAALAEPKP